MPTLELEWCWLPINQNRIHVIRWFLLIGNLVFFQCNLFAQTPSLKFAGSLAYLAPHHSDMSHLYSHVITYGVDYLVPVSSERSLGLNTTFYNIRNKVVGNGISAGVVFHNQVYSDKSLSLSTNLSLGLGYLMNSYSLNNPQNNAIGSNFNGTMRASLSLKKTTKTDLYFSIDIGLAHFSNAAFRMPNLGINMPFLSMALGKSLNSKQTNQQSKLDYTSVNKWSQLVAFRMAGKTFSIDDDRLFIFPCFDYGWTYNLNSTSQLRLLTSFNFDPVYRYQKFQKLQKVNLANSFENGISVGYQTFYGRFGLILDLGIYSYQPINKLKSIYYERVGLIYHLAKKLDIQLSLKANKTTADYSELGAIFRMY